MTGIITLSSSWPACVASSTARSLPMTWKHTMFSISAIEGLTFPGMIDDPGCTGGRRISSRPVFGPDAIRRRSLAMRVRVAASVRSAAEHSSASPMFCIDSKRLPELRSGRPVSSERRRTIRGWYCGSAFRPVPVAVPPIPM